MKKNALNGLALLGLLALATPARAQVDIGIHFDLAPRLVVVSPGIQVVEDHDDEVFFVDGFYWVRRDDRWWRSSSWRGNWVVVERRVVPSRLVVVPVGRYRHYRAVRPVRGVPTVREERTVVHAVEVERGGGKRGGKGDKHHGGGGGHGHGGHGKGKH